jgi:hypothetical protein
MASSASCRGLSRDLALGVETGAEVTVPASKYIAHVDPAVHEKIKDLIRFRPEGLTVEEAKMAPEPIEVITARRILSMRSRWRRLGRGKGRKVMGMGLYFAEISVADNINALLG